MKVKLMDFEESVIGFLRKAVDTMPTTGHKFLAGAMLASSAKRVEDALSAFADADGCIDTDQVRRLAKDGFTSAGDRVTFTVGDDRLSWLLKPVNVTFLRSDVEAALDDLELRYR